MFRQVVSGIGVVAVCQLAAVQARAADVVQLQGKGVQIYTCSKDAAAGIDAGGHFAWTLKAPEATLTSADGKVAGHHFAGPTWQADDGSAVVGEVLASGTVAEPDSQPAGVAWLVLRAKSHAGAGAFDAVTYIVRSNTAGGAAPAAGCDASHAGTEERVPYTASYTLFGVK